MCNATVINAPMNNQQVDTTQTSTLEDRVNKPWYTDYTGIAHSCK